MNTTKLYRQLQCWNTPITIEAGKFGHLSARARWLDGKCIVIARHVEDVTIHQLPEVKCQGDIDDGWLTIIVPGPCTIPARAKLSVLVRADVAQPQWLAEMSKPEIKLAEKIADKGML